MINFIEGNLLESDAEALVNPVNTVGVMGKGLALQFKDQFPENYKIYLKACKEKKLTVGHLLIHKEESSTGDKKIIINFPTKTTWRAPSEYAYIEEGLKKLAGAIKDQGIKSVAIPALGAGNGGLEWAKVKGLFIQYLSNIDAAIFIYQPNYTIKEIVKNEKVQLTPARAMLLAVLFDLVKNGEFVSEFAAEKIAYFLQRFGGKEIFNLEFAPNFYGPYSGKVKHVLHYLNGSYITGYGGKDKRPFEELGIMMDTESDVLAYLEESASDIHKKTVAKTKAFLEGFYSSFGLELLSTIDFIAQKNNTKSVDLITSNLANWSNRKNTMFSNPKYIELAIDKLLKNNL